MKRILKIMLFVVISAFVTTASADQFEVCDGLHLGMTLSEVADVCNMNNISIALCDAFEAEIEGEPFAQVYINTVPNEEYFYNMFETTYLDENCDSFSNSRLLYQHILPISIDIRTIGYRSVPFTTFLTEIERDDLFVQARCIITSDQKYDTAIDTFEKIEESLNVEYGITRYTSRRGEFLPTVIGYNTFTDEINEGVGFGWWLPQCYSVHDNNEIKTRYSQSVPYYSNRVIALNNGLFVVISHHMMIDEKEKTFSHEVMYTLLPVDISNKAVLELMATPTSQPTPDLVPTPTTTPITTSTPEAMPTTTKEPALHVFSESNDIYNVKLKLSDLGWLAVESVNGVYDGAMQLAIFNLQVWLQENWDEAWGIREDKLPDVNNGEVVDWKTMNIIYCVDKSHQPVKPENYELLPIQP